jgi:hypothetical protein
MCVVLQPHKLTLFLLVAPIHFLMGAPEWVPQILIWFRDHYLGSLKSSIGIREMPPGPATRAYSVLALRDLLMVLFGDGV